MNRKDAAALQTWAKDKNIPAVLKASVGIEVLQSKKGDMITSLAKKI
jgi:hypothetical protein